MPSYKVDWRHGESYPLGWWDYWACRILGTLCLVSLLVLVSGCGSGSDDTGDQSKALTEEVWTTEASAAGHIAHMTRWADYDLVGAQKKRVSCEGNDYPKRSSSGEDIYKSFNCEYRVTLADGTAHDFHYTIKLTEGGWDVQADTSVY